MRPRLIGVLSCLIVNGTIEKFALRLVYLLVAATMEHDEIVVPAIGHLEVLLGRGERFGHAFLDWSARLCHYSLHIMVWLQR